MDINKAKRLLAKINVLVDNQDGTFSTLENDLLKTYIKDLYECVSGLSQPAPDVIQDQVNNKSEGKPDVDVKEKEEKEIAPAPEEHKAINVTEENTVDEVDTQEIVEPVTTQTEPNKRADLTDQNEAEGNSEAGTSEAALDETEPVSSEESTIITDELEALFTLQKGNDLLSKLGSKPVTLIENAMGINERILTINELFQGDRDLFQQTVDTINRFESYDMAKGYLINGIASEQDWVSAKKAKKAAKFIRLIQRKFISS